MDGRIEAKPGRCGGAVTGGDNGAVDLCVVEVGGILLMEPVVWELVVFPLLVVWLLMVQSFLRRVVASCWLKQSMCGLFQFGLFAWIDPRRVL